MKEIKMRLTVDVTYKVDEDDAATQASLELGLDQAVDHLRDTGWLKADADCIGVTHTVGPVPLRDTVDDVNSEHPRFSRDEWSDEVFHMNTNLGYWDWVESQVDATEGMSRGGME